MGLLVETWPETWHRSRLFRVLSLGGNVACNPPLAVTGVGALLLVGIAATHVHLLTAKGPPPGHFSGYAAAVIAGCLLAAAAMASGRDRRVPKAGWWLGSLVSALLLGLGVGARVASLPAPTPLALAFAAAFIGVHISVSIGAAHPHRRHWQD